MLIPQPCLKRTAEHHRHIKCPGCRQDANPCTEFVALNEIGMVILYLTFSLLYNRKGVKW